jgi:large conductance mechanosensitive channel
MFKAFKEFAFKGNLIDMAVGIIIGGAFGTVVKSLVDNVVMPPIGKLIGDIDFSKLKIPLGGVNEETGEAVAINYGQFLQDLVSFLIIALVIFILIKKVVAAFDKKEEAPAEDPGPSEIDLLTEIRDQLKKQNG